MSGLPNQAPTDTEAQRAEQLTIDALDNDTYEIETDFIIDLPQKHADIIQVELGNDLEQKFYESSICSHGVAYPLEIKKKVTDIHRI